MKNLFGVGFIALFLSTSALAQSQQQVIQGIMGMMQQMAIEAQRQQQLRGQVPNESPLAQLGSDTVRTIQYWLIWNGYYPGPLDGDLGEGTREGIRKFQRGVGRPATGILTNGQADILSERTSRIVRDLDYAGFTDPISGVQIGIPKALVPVRERHPSGTDFISQNGRTRIALRYLKVNRSLPEVYDFVRQSAARSTIEYSVLRNDWFVVSGRHGDTSFYVRFHARDGAIAGFNALFDATADDFTAPLTITSLTMEPFASEPNVATASFDDVAGVVEPFRRIQGYDATPTTTPPRQTGSSSVWSHNGSTMRLFADGSSRRIEYLSPRPELASAGIVPGTVLFSGQRIGNRLEGRAYTFKSGCAPEPYGVTGVVASETQITLKGLVPVRRNGCKVAEKSASHPAAVLSFDWIASEKTASIVPSTGGPVAQQPPIGSGVVQGYPTLPAPIPPASLPAPIPPASPEAIEAANHLLADVQTFVRTRAPMGQVADIAVAAASLQAAVESKSSVSIREESAKLRNLLLKLDGYAAFESERNAARNAERRRVLDALTLIARKNMTFIERRIAENVTDPTVKELVRVRNETDSAINSGDAGRLQSTARQLAAFVEQNGLADVYAKFMEGENPTKDASESGLPPAASAKTRFLSDGDPEDIVVLYNSSPTAPHVAKSLDGVLTYEGQQAAVCAASGSPPESLSAQLLLSGVLPSDVRAIVAAEPCNFADNSRHDLVVMTVGESRRLTSARHERLASAIGRDELRHLRTLKKSELDELERSRQKKAMDIETELEKGSLDEGFGTLIVNPQLTIGCAVGIGDEDVHRRLLDGKYESVFFRARRDFSLSLRSPEAAFLGVQRRQCGFVHGSGAQLTRMIASLRRDGRVYEVSPHWFSAAEVQEVAQRLDADRKASREQTREWEQQREIDKLRNKQTGEEKQAQQAKLRRENGDRANGFRNQFHAEMKQALEGRDSAMFPSTLFPNFYRAIRDRRANQWELVKIDTEVDDYGTVLWKSRKVEGVLVRLLLNEKNRILGEYKDYCFVLGLVSDEEFQMTREPVEAECEAGAARIKAWKVNGSFSSKWIVD